MTTIQRNKKWLFAAACLASMAVDYTASANSSTAEPKLIEGDYRRMHNALDHLRQARNELQNAEHNHGGWRDRAIGAADNAIHETEAAINWNP